MSIFVIEFQAIPADVKEWEPYNKHQHIECVRDTLEEAIDEIVIERDCFDFVDNDTIVYDGPLDWQRNRRYLLTWMKWMRGRQYQCSYIVRELEETTEVKEAIDNNELNRLLEPNFI